MRRDINTSRRAHVLVIGTSQHYRWLYGIAQALLVLNLLDGIFTLVWVQYFSAVEVNVMLRDLVHDNMLRFMLVKLTLVSLGTLYLWRNRDRPLAVISIFIAFFAYYLVLLYHLQYTTMVLF